MEPVFKVGDTVVLVNGRKSQEVKVIKVGRKLITLSPCNTPDRFYMDTRRPVDNGDRRVLTTAEWEGHERMREKRTELLAYGIHLDGSLLRDCEEYLNELLVVVNRWKGKEP